MHEGNNMGIMTTFKKPTLERIGEGGLNRPSPSPAYSTAPPFLYQAYRLWWILQLGSITYVDLSR